MTTFSSAEAQNKLSQLLEMAEREPITITRPGQPDLFVLSEDALDELVAARKRKAAAKAFRDWADEAAKHIHPDAEKLTEEDIVRMVHELR